jgi:hypothetical protein
MKKQIQLLFQKLATIGLVFLALSTVNPLAFARPKGVSFNHGDHDHDFDRGHRYFGSPYWWYNGYQDEYASYASGPDLHYWQHQCIKVQLELARRGYYHGQINGVIDPSSRQAIRAFQQAHGLPGTGLIDVGLLKSLKLAVR